MANTLRGLSDFNAERHRRRLFQHGAGRAVFGMREFDCPAHHVFAQIHPCHDKVQMNAGEHLGVGRGALSLEPHGAATHILPPLLEDVNHVVSGTAAGAGEHDFHRPRREVVAAGLARCAGRGAVHA